MYRKLCLVLIYLSYYCHSTCRQLLSLPASLLRSLCLQPLHLNPVGEELSDAENVRLEPEILMAGLPDEKWDHLQFTAHRPAEKVISSGLPESASISVAGDIFLSGPDSRFS